MDIEKIKHLAASAKLDYTEADLTDWKEQLEGVFTWIDKLNEVDVTGVEITPSSQPMALREDIVKPFENMQGLINDFAETERNMAKVKKVL